MFTASDYALLHSMVFQPDYPGYKPNVVESPNGDGKLDDLKRYAHVAEKYLAPQQFDTYDVKADVCFNQKYWTDFTLARYLSIAHSKSLEVAVSIGIPPQFWPSKKYSALRVLEYGPYSVTNPHTDFDLFTLMCYRNLPEYFKYCDGDGNLNTGLLDYSRCQQEKTLVEAQKLNSQIHFGELMEEIENRIYPGSGRWKAHKHEVVASGLATYQYSIVFFSVPDHSAVLPSGKTVGEWMKERLERSRYER
jgi:hypothetical protein